MSNRKNEVLTLIASAVVLALNENPDVLRDLTPRVLFYGARGARKVAEVSWRLAFRLENEYRVKVAP